MSRALLLGGSFSAIPIYNALQALGVEVQLCSGNLQEPLHGYEMKTYPVNYGDANQVSTLVGENQIDFIVPSCNDVAYKTAVQVADTHSLPGFDSPEIARIISNKHEFRSQFSGKTILMPKHIDFSRETTEQLAEIQYPLLAKPNYGFSGKGILEIQNGDELQDFLQYVNPNMFSIEEKLPGSLHSHSAFIVGGIIRAEFFVDEFCLRNQFQVDCSNHPSILSTNIKQKMSNLTLQMVADLGLVDGLLHTQFLSNEEDVHIIESMRRCPGDLYGDLIEKSTKFNYYESYVQAFLGTQNWGNQPVSKVKPVIRHTIAKSESGRFKNLRISPSNFDVDLVPIIKKGDLISDHYIEKVGIAFLHPKDLDSMERLVTNSGDYFGVNYEGSSN